MVFDSPVVRSGLAHILVLKLGRRESVYERLRFLD